MEQKAGVKIDINKNVYIKLSLLREKERRYPFFEVIFKKAIILSLIRGYMPLIFLQKWQKRTKKALTYAYGYDNI